MFTFRHYKFITSGVIKYLQRIGATPSAADPQIPTHETLRIGYVLNLKAPSVIDSSRHLPTSRAAPLPTHGAPE